MRHEFHFVRLHKGMNPCEETRKCQFKFFSLICIVMCWGFSSHYDDKKVKTFVCITRNRKVTLSKNLRGDTYVFFRSLFRFSLIAFFMKSHTQTSQTPSMYLRREKNSSAILFSRKFNSME